MKKKDQTQRDEKYVQYVERMVAKRANQPKKPPSTVQAVSTQATLDRPIEKDQEHFNRVVTNWKANPNAKTLDEAVGFKHFDASQVAVIEDIRRKGRNSEGDAISEGASSVTKESKEAATHAFTYSTPIELTTEEKEKLQELTELSTVPKLIEEAKQTWFSKVFGKKSEPKSESNLKLPSKDQPWYQLIKRK